MAPIPSVFDSHTGGTVLAIGAHPDDVELGAGGFLARLARNGRRVVIGVVSTPQLAVERVEEAGAAASILGAEVMVLRPGDTRRVEDLAMYELVGLLDKLVAATQPALVLTHAKHDMHYDHRLVHDATIAALRRTPCDLLAFTSTPELNAGWTSFGQCYADITDTLDLKLAAINAHKSQVARGSIDADSCRDLARALGRLSGVPYAEGYQVLRLRI